MKLAFIDHAYNLDVVSTTEVLVDDNMTEVELKSLVDKAVSECTSYESKCKRIPVVRHPGNQPDYDGYPTRTVQEVKDIFEAAKAKYRDYQDQIKLGRLKFVEVLTKVSGHRIESPSERGPSLIVTARWNYRDFDTATIRRMA